VRTLEITLCALLCLGLNIACATSPSRWFPPVTDEPTGLVLPGKFVWIDLVTQDIEASKRFYGGLFGWTFHESDRYTRIFHEGRAIAGMVPAADAEQGSEWVGNLSVADVDAAARMISAQGGVVEKCRVDMPDRGRMALVADPEGALMLLLRSSSGDPPDQEAPLGAWFWRELWTHDVAKAVDFYSTLATYEVKEVDLDGLPYRALLEGGVPRAGIVEAPADVHPLGLPYVRVDDTLRVSDEAAALGARIVMRHERSAILVDPTGAPFAIQVWEAPKRDEGEAR
jgi:predicted enzyme related to lactoylglutathione lyase